MKQIAGPVFISSFLMAGLVLGGCAATTYVPSIRDMTEEPISGDYWYQRFTLYTPASSAKDCKISRTGRRIDLNSPAELADTWRQFCRFSPGADNSR